jgi:hypothetical protein
MSNKFKLPRVTYYTDGVRKAIATTHYAGQVVRAVAICHEDDVFDEEVGKKVAYDKLLYKFFKIKSRRLLYICNCYQEMLEDLERKRDNVYTALDETLEGYGEICGKNSEELFDEFI